MPDETPGPPAQHEYRNDVVRLPDLAVINTELSDLTFVNCRIIGPAVVIPRSCQFVACSWDVPTVGDLFWEISEDRGIAIGAIGLTNCMFSQCAFTSVGLAGPPEMREQLDGGLNVD